VKCEGAVDMGFLIDSSGSISKSNWVKMKQFVSDTIQEVMKEDSDNRFAAAIYATIAEKVFDFKKLGAGASHSDYESLVNQMRHMKGFTFIDKALDLANRDIFSAAGGMRPNVAKVLYKRCLFFKWLD
jgi:hypothetical protein